MSSTTLSIRIKSELKKKMEELKDVDWRKEIEEFIEKRIREIELRKIMESIDRTLKNIKPSMEPAWKDIREFREGR